MLSKLAVGVMCGVLGLAAVPAAAGPVVLAGDSVRFANGAGDTGGGEFEVTVNGAWAFITFCLQHTEYIDFSNTFTVDSVNPYTLTDPPANGGDGSGRDDITAQTAYLYTMFRAGTLAGYNYLGAGHVASADDLQRALWMFEDEMTMNLANPFVQLANDAVSDGLWSGIGNVRVMNLSLRGVEAQDQLTLVPEPASLVLVAGGLAAFARRRRRQ